MPRPRRATAADVAEEAGVSTATVSYVLNDTPGQKISTTTAARVRAAAKELGYVMNPTARALARGETTFVIIDMSVFPRSEASDAGFYGFSRYLDDRGYTTLLTWWGPERWEQQLIKLALDTSATRVITSIPASEATREALRTAGVKTISSILADPGDLVVPLQLAATEQVKYLAARGHTNLLYVRETAPELLQLDALRGGASERTATELGLDWNAARGSPDLLEHREQVQRALAEHPKATAIIAYNDDVALRTLSALQSLGVTVPEEVSLIGVDNRPFSRDTHPPLTTVSYSYAMAELTPEVIETFVEGAGRSGLATDITAAVHVETLERESVGPPRASTRTALPGYPNAN